MTPNRVESGEISHSPKSLLHSVSIILMCHLVHAIECYLVLFSVILCFLVLSHADDAYHLVISPATIS